MTYGIGTREDFFESECDRFPRKTLPQKFSGAVALAVSLLVGGSLLYARLADEPRQERRQIGLRAAAAAHRAAKREAAQAKPANVYGALLDPGMNTYGALVDPGPNVYGELLDPKFAETAAVPFAQSHPLGAKFAAVSPVPRQVADLELRGSVEELDTPQGRAQATEQATTQGRAPQQQVALQEQGEEATLPPTHMVQTVPLPAPRPSNLGFSPSHIPLRSAGHQVQQENTTVAAAEPDNRSFFEKLFGDHKDTPPGLAYASAESGTIGNQDRMAGIAVPMREKTAIYNIAAHTVYMPDGTRLEAHSGLGEKMDDPHSVDEKMRGATPPSVYELQPREALFHGVQALRLIPVNGSDPYGRTGLLAHSYMLGPYGASNGCVSFKDYNAFLQAYMAGKVKRLVVVAGL